MASDQEAKKLFFEIFFQCFETLQYILSNDNYIEFFLKAANEKEKGDYSVKKGNTITFNYDDKKLTYGNVDFKNDHIEEQKQKTDEYEMCCDFMLFQLYSCIRNINPFVLMEEQYCYNNHYDKVVEQLINDFKKVGFVAPSPWHGDITKAKVIFIGPNPTIDVKCLYPRFHIDGTKTKITLAGEPDTDIEFRCCDPEIHKKCLLCNGCNLYDFHLCERYSNILLDIETEKILKQEIDEGQQNKIYNFFVNRIQPACSESDKIGKLIYNVNQGTYIIDKVTYWNGIIEDAKTINISHDLILSTEIIPFGSENSFGFNKHKESCYKTFLRILELCEAQIIVLQGIDATTSFASIKGVTVEYIKKEDRKNQGKEKNRGKLISGKPCKVNININNINRDFYVVSVSHVSRRENDDKAEAKKRLNALADEVKTLLQ